MAEGQERRRLVRQRAKEDGWKTRVEDGAWVDICPDCLKKEKANVDDS